ncbi:hypothetical protein ACJ5NV_10600 [Loktanella agnita]|uniref:hypothetical protein n=1 Tax=Loktanella agnita TaxID=287097 RepID=UPI0039865C29
MDDHATKGGVIMVMEALDTLEGKFAECETLAFADLSTQMILVTNTTTQLRREALDKLCSEAALALGTDKKVPFGQKPGGAAIVAGKGEIKIFLRASHEPTDVLCCVCSAGLDIDTFLEDARPCLDKISSGG